MFDKKNKNNNAVDRNAPVVNETKEVKLTKDQRVSINGIALINLIGMAEQASYSIPYSQVQSIIDIVKNGIALIDIDTEKKNEKS